MKATTIILVILSLCVACGEKNVVNIIEQIYDDGIERVQKAKEAKDVQKIYDDVTQKVKDVKNMHLKEFAELDSTTNTLQKSEETLSRYRSLSTALTLPCFIVLSKNQAYSFLSIS